MERLRAGLTYLVNWFYPGLNGDQTQRLSGIQEQVPIFDNRNESSLHLIIFDLTNVIFRNQYSTYTKRLDTQYLSKIRGCF